MTASRVPVGLRLYGRAAQALLPLAWARVSRKLAAAGMPEGRRRERLGHATHERPEGRLVWVHAASLGESLSALDLVGTLGRLSPGISVLVTTGTASSATVLADRLPSHAFHQFAPLDAPGPVGRFLRHWRPDLAVLVESEVWPQTILSAHAAGIPVALINARLSERSLSRWERWPGAVRALLSRLALVRTQGEELARRLVALGADTGTTRAGPDLKAAAPAPPDDPAKREPLAAEVGGRPVWTALSTHPGEEEIVLEAHAIARKAVPGLLLILVPRHPERGDAVEALASQSGGDLARRSRGEMPDRATSVYLADTLGEAGVWLRMAEVVALGGGWAPVGGHNPWEPAALGRPVLSGPGVRNAAAGFEALKAAGAAELVEDGAALGRAVLALFAEPERRARMGEAAQAAARAARGSPEVLAQELLALMEGRG